MWTQTHKRGSNRHIVKTPTNGRPDVKTVPNGQITVKGKRKKKILGYSKYNNVPKERNPHSSLQP